MYVTRILLAMGLSDAAPHGIGFGNERTVSQRAADCLDACTGFRDQVGRLHLQLALHGCPAMPADRPRCIISALHLMGCRGAIEQRQFRVG